MTKREFSELKELLSTPKNVVIVPHKNADGDAVGSALAMYHFLTHAGHQAQVVSPNTYPDFLKWMPGTENVIQFDYQNKQSKRAITNADLIFLLDFNDLSRVGDDMQKFLETYQGTFVMIDHHQQPSSVAKYLFSDISICATAQMVYHFFEQIDEVTSITPDIATCLYTGILTDTGSFRFPKTTPTTHRIVADLIERGADNATIYNNVYDVNSYGRLQLLGQSLKNLKVLPEYKTAYISLTEAEKEAHDFQKGDTEGVVNYALSMKGVIFGVIFIEDKEQKIIKISFRSKGDFSVNQFARAHFNGGGHDNAAGGRSEESMEATISNFIALLPQYKDALIDSYED
jgi:phosphoesterase RecJ-like protein